MEWAVFWHIVEGARAEVGTDTERVTQVLLRRLRALAPDEIEQFDERWRQAQNELYRWPIRDAATLLLGPFDDDDSLAVQDWILSHGRQTIQRVQDDPDSLVELAPNRHTLGSTGSAASRSMRTSPQPGLLRYRSAFRTRHTRRNSGRPDRRDPHEAAFPRLTAYLDSNPWIERPWERAAS